MRFPRPISAIAYGLGPCLLAAALFSVLPAGPAQAQKAGTWAFAYPDDTKPGTWLDLRSLNEKTAGESGFVRLSADGNSFVLGSGKPVRFWAIGSDLYRGSPEEMARHARFLAKMGVNMVRLHTQISSTDPNSQVTDVNQKEIDGIWRMVAALKKEGIYTTISPYWATGKPATNWGIDGYTGTTDLWGILFFNEQLQKGYKAWVKALYAPMNPYTGIPLARDPAVALIQIQNEDGMFFWTMQGLKPPQKALLGRKFGQWLVKKYGSFDAIKQAWGGVGTGDDWGNGQIAILDTWVLTQPQTGGMARRVHDQVQFFAETQRRFYADIARYYRNDLGCGQLINASNWITADSIHLGDIERWTYTADDVIAVNKYYGGVHSGDNNGWRIDEGHTFTDTSALLDPRDLPTNLKQPLGHPMVITESSWVSPLGYQSEGPFLMAAYQSLTGVDIYYWFSADVPEYRTDPFFNFITFPDGEHALVKWSASIPPILGSFPAAALTYRLGYLMPGTPAVIENRPLEALWNRQTPIIAEDKSFDPNRDTGNTTQRSNLAKGVDPLAFLVGPVQVNYGGNPAQDKVINLSQYIDHPAGIVKSDTGQIWLDYVKGVCVVNAPKMQGVTGFLQKAPDVALSDVEIKSGNAYATVSVVSLDGRPLRSSDKILVQVVTMARPTGWETRKADFKSDDGKQTFHGYQIVKTGTTPWQMANTDVTLTVTNPKITTATLLDTAGYPVKSIAGTRAGGNFTLKLPANTMYMILRSDNSPTGIR